MRLDVCLVGSALGRINISDRLSRLIIYGVHIEFKMPASVSRSSQPLHSNSH